MVVTPRFVPKLLVQNFVTQHQDWIADKLATFQKIKKKADTVSIYGKEYSKVVKYLPKQKLGILVRGGEVVFNTPEAGLQLQSSNPKKQNKQSLTIASGVKKASSAKGSPEETLQLPAAKEWGKSQEKALERFLKSTAQVYVIKRTEQLAEKMNVTFKNITLREQSSRWGSCSSAGNLNFNWRLVHAEPNIIDYVIVHELAHRVHMDHSRSFWALVAKFDPEYQIHRGWLKRQGHALS